MAKAAAIDVAVPASDSQLNGEVATPQTTSESASIKMTM